MICAKINEELIFIFLTGITVGFILNVLFCEKPINSNARSVSVNVEKIRILCILNVMPESDSIQSMHNLHAWHRHCDKFIYDRNATESHLDEIDFNATNDRLKLTFLYIHQHYRNDFDWIFKGDDDSFFIPENLRFLLSAFSPNDPIYFGYESRM